MSSTPLPATLEQHSQTATGFSSVVRRWLDSRSLQFALLILVWAGIHVPGMFAPPILDDADAGHAELSREMLVTHDYVTMHADGVRYFDKAPLPYWIIAGSYKLLGATVFATRLPISLFTLGLIFSVYWFARNMAGGQAGFFSALVIATTIGPYIYTRFCIPDILVTLWLAITVHLFFLGMEQERPSALLCAGIGVVSALNVLTKGLIGIVFPIVIFVGYAVLTRTWRKLVRFRLMPAAISFLVIAAPWHVLAILRNPPNGDSKGFFWFYFINEQVNRFLNTRIPRDYDKVPLVLFWGLLLVWMIPWSPYLISALRDLFAWRKIRAAAHGEDRGLLLLGVWALAILVFFSFSTRQEYYVLPSLPALAIMTGVWLSREAHSQPGTPLRRSGLRSSGLMFAIGAAVFAIATGFAVMTPRLPASELVATIQRHPSMYRLSMGHLFDLTGKAMGAFHGPLVLFGTAILLGTLLNWLVRRSSPPAGNLALSAMMVGVLYAVHIAFGVFYPILGSEPLAAAIERYMRPDSTIVFDGQYSLASSINFYTQHEVHMLNGRANDLWYGSLSPDCPQVFEDNASFARLWGSGKPVFFVGLNYNSRKKLEMLGPPFYEIANAGGKYVFTNFRPSQ